ncbi:hypothetical protein C8R45DRAFT_291714 [Mycena sanguinolenta]|nr:hypothetical protein C8R45DRAFT_291714 [Mycena sanguinolenta]
MDHPYRDLRISSPFSLPRLDEWFVRSFSINSFKGLMETTTTFPMSAYDIVQEVTYQRNVTHPAFFMSTLIPFILNPPTDNFTPQLLNVGDAILLDGYIFNHIIAQAFNGGNTSKQVSVFSYYNNPLSDSCDVTNITAQLLLTNDLELGWNPQLQVGGTVACYMPTPFYLTWVGLPDSDEEQFVRKMPYWISVDIYIPSRKTCSLARCGVDQTQTSINRILPRFISASLSIHAVTAMQFCRVVPSKTGHSYSRHPVVCSRRMHPNNPIRFPDLVNF